MTEADPPGPAYHRHLPDTLVPLQDALFRRANLLSTHEGHGRVHLREAIDRALAAHGTAHITADVLADAIADVLAHEMRTIAEQMHYW